MSTDSFVVILFNQYAILSIVSDRAALEIGKVYTVSERTTLVGASDRLKRHIFHNFRLLTLLISRELKVKYRNSVLGYLWSMLNPLLFMTIISLVFSRLIKGVEHYELYVLTGILFWNMTSMSIVGATNSLVNNSGLLRKVRVPYWVFVVVPVGAAAVNCVLALAPYMIIALLKGLALSPKIVLVPFIIALYSVFVASIGSILATLNVYFRDVGHIIEPILQLGFYATPIIYDRQNSAFPDWARELIRLNPLVHFLDLFRAALFSSNFFSLSTLLIAVSWTLLGLVVSAFIDRRFAANLSFRI